MTSSSVDSILNEFQLDLKPERLAILPGDWGPQSEDAPGLEAQWKEQIQYARGSEPQLVQDPAVQIIFWFPHGLFIILKARTVF